MDAPAARQKKDSSLTARYRDAPHPGYKQTLAGGASTAYSPGLSERPAGVGMSGSSDRATCFNAEHMLPVTRGPRPTRGSPKSAENNGKAVSVNVLRRRALDRRTLDAARVEAEAAALELLGALRDHSTLPFRLAALAERASIATAHVWESAARLARQ